MRARLIATIEQQLGKRAVIERLPMQAGDVPITYADISKARSLLGYQPATSLAEGLKAFIEWSERRALRAQR